MSFADGFEQIITTGFRIESASIRFSLLRASFGGGYDMTAGVGHPDGLRAWAIRVDVLPHTSDYLINAGEFGLQTRAQYLWDFYCRHKQAGDKSFRIVDPVDERTYLARFVDNDLTFHLLTRKLYSTGLSIEQRREVGVDDSGDAVLFDNTQAI